MYGKGSRRFVNIPFANGKEVGGVHEIPDDATSKEFSDVDGNM